ncbi:hypothetical protein GCM10009839_54740 [Catenulispora yoronensis]|uniref:Uncharacterized protein n=1 Tax=Catenulispora yoronensis TaxID=450799 RepID=A0ABP5GEH9_9ACTN
MKAADRAADGSGAAGGDGAAEHGSGTGAEDGGGGAGGVGPPRESRLRRASDILNEVLFGGSGGRRSGGDAGDSGEPGSGSGGDSGGEFGDDSDYGDSSYGDSSYGETGVEDGVKSDAELASEIRAAGGLGSASGGSASYGFIPPSPRVPVGAAAAASAPRTTPLTWDAPAPGDEATRYLCAAAHVDAAFARRALREFVFDDGRAPAPSAGVDEILVLRHCLAARARRLHRDTALVALVFVALLVSVWTVAAWLLWGAGLRLLLSGAGVGPGPQPYGAPSSEPRGPRSASVMPMARFAALLWGACGGAFLLTAAGLAHPFGIHVADHLRNVGPGSPWVAWLFVPLAAAGTAWSIVFVERVAARHVLVDRLRRDRFATHRWVTTETVWARRALAELAARDASDRQVLADPARPFAGSGRQVLRRRWLLETGPIRYDVQDMIERVTDALAAGVPGLGPEGLLDAVVWDDFVVATGPVLAVGQTTDASLRLLPSPRGAAAPRVFRRFRILSDPAETVVTAYLSASSAPGLALVEVHGLVLEPVAAAYRGVDRLPRLGLAAALLEAWYAAATLPRLLFGAPAAAVAVAADPLRRRHRRAVLDRAAARGLPVAEGARTSLRELAVAGGAGNPATAAGAGPWTPAPLVDREGAPFAREDANLALAVVERRVREALRPLL